MFILLNQIIFKKTIIMAILAALKWDIIIFLPQVNRKLLSHHRHCPDINRIIFISSVNFKFGLFFNISLTDKVSLAFSLSANTSGFFYGLRCQQKRQATLSHCLPDFDQFLLLINQKCWSELWKYVSSGKHMFQEESKRSVYKYQPLWAAP